MVHYGVQLRKRLTGVSAGMPLMGSILKACGATDDDTLVGMKSVKGFSSNYNAPTSSQRKLAIGVLVAIIVIPAVILLSFIALICLCLRRRRANKRRALAKEPKFYPEVSYLYDPPPGAPSPNPVAPNQAYHGAAGVAAGPEQQGLLAQNIPSARSVMAPLSGYSRAEQNEGGADLADKEHLNPFRDNASGEYRDSIDNQPRH